MKINGVVVGGGGGVGGGKRSSFGMTFVNMTDACFAAFAYGSGH